MCMPCAPFRILAPWATAFNAHSIDTHVPTLSISLPLLGALWEKMVLSLSFQGSGAHLFAHQLHPQSLEAPPFDNGIPMVARASTVPTQVVRGCPVHKNCENNNKIHIFLFYDHPAGNLRILIFSQRQISPTSYTWMSLPFWTIKCYVLLGIGLENKLS